MALLEPSSQDEKGTGYDDKENQGCISENVSSVAAPDEADGAEDTRTEGGYWAWATVLGG